MKLINFLNVQQFNDLRAQMNAPLVNLESTGWETIDERALLERLNSIEGIEIDIEELVIVENGTFEFKGQKVLLYIRDQYFIPNKPSAQYKYHIAHCKTLEEAFQRNRSERYVVSTRTDGYFRVNIRDYYTKRMLEESVIKKLQVCKNCLMRLQFKGYTSHTTGSRIYKNFSLEEFFELYRTTPHTIIPKHTDRTAPRSDTHQLYKKNVKRVR
ncbi:MAG: hypothetical protein N3A63_01130 [Bacteroidetes bacterium]|nr:hypothetical protein [Bacteroidota bacterium]